ncbi:Gfo/Idh/MocA family oxidoreductase [Maricaulaceae bacterium EIL42A08]|nr:Gfo/Idh/MocA family oxidoreductase [Maricaulaceae bacterium EIL42A08]
MGKVRWGILGAGRIARTFASDIVFTSNAALQAVGARDGQRAAAFAKDFSIPTAHGSYEALVDDPDVDAIYVATPHNFHLEQSLAAIKAGKAVLCEKPLTPSLEDSQTLIEAAHRHDIFLMEAMWSYFLPSLQRAKAWLDEGRIGEVIQIRADLGFAAHFDPKGRLYDPALAGGALLDIGIYPIAFNRLMLGQGPDEVTTIFKMAETGVDEDVSAVFQTGSVTSVLTCSFRCPLPNAGLVIGTKGRIEVPGFWHSNSARLYEGDTLVESFEDGRKGSGFEFEIEAASKDILDDRTQSGVASHAVSLALQSDMARVRAAAAE